MGFLGYAHNANYAWFEHNGIIYLRNAAGQISRSPYQTEAALLESMADHTLRQLTNPPSFNSILTSAVGPAPVGMFDPHAHHILFYRGNGGAQRELVAEGQAILRSVGIDPIFGTENLVWAPNHVTDQHAIDALQPVVDTLRKVLDQGGGYQEIVEALKTLGQVAARRG